MKLNQHNQLVMYNPSHYLTYQQAAEFEAVYRTPSTIDCLDTTQMNLSAMRDLVEVVEAFEKCMGLKGELKAGIESIDGEFISLELLIKLLEDENQ